MTSISTLQIALEATVKKLSERTLTYEGMKRLIQRETSLKVGAPVVVCVSLLHLFVTTTFVLYAYSD